MKQPLPPLSLNASQVELAQQVAVACHCALSLVHLNQYPGLVVPVRREHLRLIHRHRRVALDERRHHAAGRLQFKAQSCHIQQQGRVELARLLLAREDGSLRGGNVGHGLVGVDGLAAFLAIEVGSSGYGWTRPPTQPRGSGPWTSWRQSISMCAWVDDESVRFGPSHAVVSGYICWCAYFCGTCA